MARLSIQAQTSRVGRSGIRIPERGLLLAPSPGPTRNPLPAVIKLEDLCQKLGEEIPMGSCLGVLGVQPGEGYPYRLYCVTQSCLDGEIRRSESLESLLSREGLLAEQKYYPERCDLVLLLNH